METGRQGELCIFLQRNQEKMPEFVQAKQIAEDLQTYLNQNDVNEKIREAKCTKS